MMLLTGIFFLSINFSTALWQALLAGAFYGITIAMAIVPLMAMIQSTVKEEMMGRVMSLLCCHLWASSRFPMHSHRLHLQLVFQLSQL
jgi:hypothetical protein